jgi:hypothetical protein
MNKNTLLKNLIDKKKNNEIIQDKIEKDRIADLLKNLEKTNKKLNQDSSKLDICVIMFYTENIKDYANINYKINKMYCEKYNIDIILSHDLFYTQRTVHWERLPLLLKYIKNYDYIIWIDADAFFYIDSLNIIDIINKNLNIDFIFSNDAGNLNINTGFFIIKNSEYSINFLIKWAFDNELYKNNSAPFFWDQGVLIDMYKNNIFDIQNKSIIYDYGILQHFNENHIINIGIKPFILHLPGKNNKERLDISLNYYNKINFS